MHAIVDIQAHKGSPKLSAPVRPLWKPTTDIPHLDEMLRALADIGDLPVLVDLVKPDTLSKGELDTLDSNVPAE